MKWEATYIISRSNFVKVFHSLFFLKVIPISLQVSKCCITPLVCNPFNLQQNPSCWLECENLQKKPLSLELSLPSYKKQQQEIQPHFRRHWFLYGKSLEIRFHYPIVVAVLSEGFGSRVQWLCWKDSSLQWHSGYAGGGASVRWFDGYREVLVDVFVGWNGCWNIFKLCGVLLRVVWIVSKIPGYKCQLTDLELDVSFVVGFYTEKLRWNLNITQLKRSMIYQTSIFGFPFKFSGVLIRSINEDPESWKFERWTDVLISWENHNYW